MRLRLLRSVLLIVTITVLQHSILDGVQFYGVHLDLPLLLVICAGFSEGREGGAVIGFAVGLLSDGFLITPFGLSALVYSLIGYIAGQTEKGSFIGPLTINAALASFLSAFGVLGYEIASRLLGFGQLLHVHLVKVVLVVAVTNAVLSVIMVPLAKWAFASRELNSRPPVTRR
ncbi:MAG: rod shape-determining protein MreD [Acidimicrobiaceae bacterium]|nr:rod shape-determining protein MreD [Acidimicrobiaceae bacterium]